MKIVLILVEILLIFIQTLQQQLSNKSKCTKSDISYKLTKCNNQGTQNSN